MIKPIIFLLTLLSLLSFYPIDENYLLLVEADFDYSREDNLTPALTIPDIDFESFNKWQCFDAEKVEFANAEVDYNGVHSVPSMQIENMTFDLDPDIAWNTNDILSEWKELTDESKTICVFGAFLQKNSDDSSFWYIETIKTATGYWLRKDKLKEKGASRLW